MYHRKLVIIITLLLILISAICSAHESKGGQSPKNKKYVVKDVPYFCQYNNSYYPQTSCQNTAMAMVLNYYGWRGDADDITMDYGKQRTQWANQFTTVFNNYAQKNNLGIKIKTQFNCTPADLDRILRSGRPVIAHGYFTNAGHVVVLVGYDHDYYYVNDPAGQWNRNYKGDYYVQFGGKYIKYSRQAVISALGGPGNIWIHKPISIGCVLNPGPDQSISIF